MACLQKTNKVVTETSFQSSVLKTGLQCEAEHIKLKHEPKN